MFLLRVQGLQDYISEGELSARQRVKGVLITGGGGGGCVKFSCRTLANDAILTPY